MYNSTRIDSIHIVFENCESIEVPMSDVRYIHLDDIRQSVWENNILFKKDFDLKYSKSASFCRLIIKDKPKYDRVNQYQDITWIYFYRHGQSIDDVSLNWADGSSDYSNLGQTIRKEDGELDITIQQIQDKN